MKGGKIVRVRRYLYTLILSSLAATCVYMIDLGYFHYIPLVAVTIILIVCYAIFAIPVQVFLNRNPKKFNFKYLFIYSFVSFLVWYIFAITNNADDVFSVFGNATIYFYSITFAAIFWFWDSVFLQIKSNKEKV
ncbi:hypothetical protein COP00_03430 [Bacillus glycinifermentans]|uniref:UPF0715 family protein n=1 Tax=Bacillus glycinifermentans TaxID=1664069 RepID=UPI000BC2F295|nr:UPF0715 family protein [Bacillus glycinifermentans]ATH91781.1 hypothetical protein COP00_03430 [Bacillus glycinifermentans]